MNFLKKGSTWLKLLEQLTYVCPTLVTVLYYYFTQIEMVTSQSSKASFALAVVIFILFIIYKKAMHKHIEDLRQATVQTKTDLKNGVGDADKVATNLAKMQTELDTYNRMALLLSLLCCSIAVYILEQAAIAITNLVVIGLISVASGSGIHVGVIQLQKRENLKEVQNEKQK